MEGGGMTRGTIATARDDRDRRPHQGRPQRAQGPPLVVQRDDGMFEIGTGINPAGPFPSRPFAEAVAARLP